MHDDDKDKNEIEAEELKGISGGGPLKKAGKKVKKAAKTFPDISKTPTPGGPVPIPYPNITNDES